MLILNVYCGCQAIYVEAYTTIEVFSFYCSQGFFKAIWKSHGLVLRGSVAKIGFGTNLVCNY